MLMLILMLERWRHDEVLLTVLKLFLLVLLVLSLLLVAGHGGVLGSLAEVPELRESSVAARLTSAELVVLIGKSCSSVRCDRM